MLRGDNYNVKSVSRDSDQRNVSFHRSSRQEVANIRYRLGGFLGNLVKCKRPREVRVILIKAEVILIFYISKTLKFLIISFDFVELCSLCDCWIKDILREKFNTLTIFTIMIVINLFHSESMEPIESITKVFINK